MFAVSRVPKLNLYAMWKDLYIDKKYDNFGYLSTKFWFPKRDLIHRRRVTHLMKQMLYPQATTAVFCPCVFGGTYILGLFNRK